MTRQLHLLRHAESEEKQPGQPDLERSLTTSGMRHAAQLGVYLHKRDEHIDTIYTSTAQRAQKTAELICDALRYPPSKVQPHEELYDASTRTFLSFVSAIDDDFNNVICVGHNPVITYLAEYLTKAEIGDVSACGLVMILFELESWKLVTEGSGELIRYLHPGMLLE